MANTNDAVMAIAKTAFQHFQQGVATGNWQPYLDMLIEDYYFWYPIPGPFHGENRGRDRVAAYCRGLTETSKLTLSNPHNITADGNTVIFEFDVVGHVQNQPFSTRALFVYDVRDNKIAGHREYIGDIAPFLAMASAQ